MFEPLTDQEERPSRADAGLRLPARGAQKHTKAQAAEYGARGVRVNAVAPGPTRTPMNEGFADMADQIAALAPAGRQGEPKDSPQ